MRAAGTSREPNYAFQTAGLVQKEGWKRGSRRGKSTTGLSPCFYPFLQDHVFIRDEVGHGERRPDLRPTHSVQNQALHYRNRERFATIKSASLVSSHHTPCPTILFLFVLMWLCQSGEGVKNSLLSQHPFFFVGIATRYCKKDVLSLWIFFFKKNVC